MVVLTCTKSGLPLFVLSNDWVETGFRIQNEADDDDDDDDDGGYIDGLGDAVEKGLVKAVCVSNYSGNSQ
ncbi:hypothetical protein MTR_3g449840 [Medicago truncatula]|uniref:Uncharacterized protein n=1 Tax=Medicago truncatula TaxID=3880 RepID=A0A072UW42_MEDTR|nr:hypothetical protein MTR_3g449840 [Medicago truncatula]